MTTIVVALIVLVVVLTIINFGAMVKIFGAGRAQVGKLGRLAEEADPLALLNQAVEDGVNSIQTSKKGLENYRALILSVQRQVESGEKERPPGIAQSARRRSPAIPARPLKRPPWCWPTSSGIWRPIASNWPATWKSTRTSPGKSSWGKPRWPSCG